ncbi:hypothetical protein BS50DRAFT_478674 [Corynespora cassiicola Philippines]|uniref:FAD-binding FR-type domain-containing protein n=1 Tax=Corynespora cassiicola Philippines TaxID=1448308 RepID=A0A2T2PBX7_CORCC|nr:hypothetical protein BS50DRAFT_478674 [Corynespora cassiicola Philippines]
MAFSLAMNWNEGEEKMHQLLHVPDHDNPTASMLTQQASFMLQRGPLLALGTLDSQSRPWTTLWGGSPGFSQPLGGGIIGTRTIVDGTNDPVVQALVGNVEKGEMVQGSMKMISGLAIDLMTRKRVKIFGRMVAGCVGEVDVEFDGQDQIQLVTKIEQSLGNCPKYLNQYELKPALVTPNLVSQSATLSDAAMTLVRESDMFFLSSTTDSDMDTNHRGGPPGFVRLLSPTSFIYPEYSGNRLYQTLGNLHLDPKVGVTFPDYKTGTVLYTTGTAEILIGPNAAALLPGSNLAVKINVREARLVDGGLPFRGTKKEASPYNPRVRTLPSEGNVQASIASAPASKSATLTKKTLLTPTIARFHFSIPDGIAYAPGQWVALDFKSELDMGYEHMRDDDPRSLNDDFVRTFTISSPPKGKNREVQREFEMTIRNVGPVTKFLFTQNERAGFEVPVLGTGGDFGIGGDARKKVFLAGGVGITPLLACLEEVQMGSGGERGFKLMWTVREEDLELVLDTVALYPALAEHIDLFVTGVGGGGAAAQEKLDTLKQKRIVIQRRRISQEDLKVEGVETWYLCVSLQLRSQLVEWLAGQNVAWEDFY